MFSRSFKSNIIISSYRNIIRRSSSSSSSSSSSVKPFFYQELFDISHDDTPYRKITDKYVTTIEVYLYLFLYLSSPFSLFHYISLYISLFYRLMV